jgi:hypothetical protein
VENLAIRAASACIYLGLMVLVGPSPFLRLVFAKGDPPRRNSSLIRRCRIVKVGYQWLMQQAWLQRFSEAATSLLIARTKVQDTEVRLLHVVEPFLESLAKDLGSKDSPDFVAARLERRNWAEELLAHSAEKLQSAGVR